MSATGKCLCGATTYEGLGEVSQPGVCHCEDCRRWIGGPLMVVEFSGGMRIDGPVKWRKTSDWAERGWCAECGSAIFYRLQNGAMQSASLGSLDDPEAAGAIKEHIFVDRKMSCYDFKDDAPRMTADEVFAKYADALS